MNKFFVLLIFGFVMAGGVFAFGPPEGYVPENVTSSSSAEGGFVPPESYVPENVTSSSSAEGGFVPPEGYVPEGAIATESKSGGSDVLVVEAKSESSMFGSVFTNIYVYILAVIVVLGIVIVFILRSSKSEEVKNG